MVRVRPDDYGLDRGEEPMYCPQCGVANDETAKFCSTCGLDLQTYREQWQDSGKAAAEETRNTYQNPANQVSTYQQPPYQQYQSSYQQQYQPPHQSYPYQGGGGYGTIPRVPSYMGWAIAVLILCFWPTGIAAVVYASQVGTKLAIGDINGARESSRKAKMWCWISFGIAIAGVVISILIWIFAAAATLTIY
ncbi:MAG: zinc-ribbon domain-containing protein [Actinobacteria bacterium]|nr:zinc-ribbon domain-containing protein [Actinomycetota bacterium]